MSKVSIEKTTETIKLYTYKYIWQTQDDKLCVKFITDVQEGHQKFQTQIRDDANIKSCMREYINEVNLAYINFTEPVKQENKEKEGDKNEKV